jgi:hypothetical protein
MAALGATNALYPAYRNSVAGATNVYSTRVDADTDVLFGFFVDHAGATPDEGHDFQSDLTAGENPSFANASANPGARLTVTVATTLTTAAAGVVDFADLVFTGSTVLTGSATMESFNVAKLITNAAASPLLAYYGSATGLALTVNGADVTVVVNASGGWRF